MTSLCSKCDVIVHEATLENELWESCLDKGHSTPGEKVSSTRAVQLFLSRCLGFAEMAANFAKSAEASQLIITHFSQRYKSIEDKEVLICYFLIGGFH